MPFRAVLARPMTMAVMPTGQGKSLCYQFPATLFTGGQPCHLSADRAHARSGSGHKAAKDRGRGISLRPHGVEKRRVIQDLNQKRLQLYLCAPERMQHEGFLQLLRSLWVSLLVVDEAHCISQWGHDFGPIISKCGRLRQELTNPPCLALTATATARVQTDMCKRLSLRDPFRLVAGFRREFLLAGLAKPERIKRKIRPTETRYQSERIAERQPVADIRLHTGRGRGSQSKQGGFVSSWRRRPILR